MHGIAWSAKSILQILLNMLYKFKNYATCNIYLNSWVRAIRTAASLNQPVLWHFYVWFSLPTPFYIRQKMLILGKFLVAFL